MKTVASPKCYDTNYIRECQHRAKEWIRNTSEVKVVFVFLAVGYLGDFVLFLEREGQEKNPEGGGESSDHRDTIEGARAVCPGDEKAQRGWELISNV